MNRFSLRLIPLLATLSLCSPAANAVDSVPPYYIAPMASYVMADDGRSSGNAIGGVLAAGAHLTRLVDLEVLGSYLSYKGKGATQKFSRAAGGAGLNFYLYRADDGSGPFIHGDVMGVTRTYYNYGLGYDFMFGRGGFGLRAEALLHNDNLQFHEGQFNLGVRIPFGALPVPVLLPPPAPPAPAEVAVIEPPVAPPPAPVPLPAPCIGSSAGQAINLAGCKMGDNIVLRGVNFDFDKDTLTLNAKVILDQVVDALKKRTDIKVEIGGHTDAKGTVPYNRKLSDRRAASVRQYLLAQGIGADRMTSVGYGKVVAIASNDTDEGRELNRRVELTVTAADPAAGGVTTEQAGVPDEVALAPVVAVAAQTPAVTPVVLAGAPATSGVSISDYLYVPARQTVAVGGTVTWTNNDRVTHTVTFDGADIKIKAGETYSRTYPTAGTFPYLCSIHPGMNGTIEVLAP